MTEQLIQHNTAKLAKEKGFDLETINSVCFHHDKFLNTNKVRNSIPINWNKEKTFESEFEEYSVPTQSLLQKWLRDVKKIDIEIVRHYPESARDFWIGHIKFYRKNILRENEDYLVSLDVFPNEDRGVYEAGTYEEALETSLIEALKSIQNI